MQGYECNKYYYIIVYVKTQNKQIVTKTDDVSVTIFMQFLKIVGGNDDDFPTKLSFNYGTNIEQR